MKFIQLFIFFLLLIPFYSSANEEEDSTAAAISRFRDYLRINTAHPNPDYSTTITFLRRLATSAGLAHQTLEFVAGKPLLLLTWHGRIPNLPSILFNSHTDVVPAEPTKWAHDPFAADVAEDGGIHARGSQDMKCVGMQYIEAVRQLNKDGFRPDRNVHFSFVPDEEIGGSDGAREFSLSEKFRSLNVELVIDEGLANPGPEYRVFFAERSPWWLAIKAEGAPGHGAKLYDGSAMENLLKSIEVVRRFRASQFDMVKAGERSEGEVISVNAVYLKAGTPSPTGFVMNIQPSEAEAGFDIRVPPNADTEALERRIAEEWAPSSRNMTFEFKQKTPVNNMFGKPAITVANSSNPWWTLLEEAVLKAGGKLAKPEVFPASTDARFFRELGIPAFGFSPMANTPILLHNHNEFLNQAEYLKGVEVYKSIISTLSSSKAESGDKESKAEL